MCGLAGIVSFDAARQLSDPVLTGGLSQTLAHRGPDGAGSYLATEGRALLVHRRLAILDLSEAGAQPMRSRDGRYWLVFNGEVYNYRELRRELAADGEQFETQSDTEVLLRVLERKGPAALARIRGMFALALWDDRDQVILLARDRFGIKPLYLSMTARRLVFASEIATLRQNGLVDLEVSPSAVLAYLSWSSVPAPLTYLEGLLSLPPGTWRRWRLDGSDEGACFADVRGAYRSPPEPATISEPELRERVAGAVQSSLDAHLVADVPVGIFLSGGIDSSALVSAASSVADGNLHTYTVVVDNPAYSEERFARQIADHFKTTHHVLEVTGKSTQDDLPHILAHMDQPTADAINSYFVSKAVASAGLKCVLSGTGGDELFGGYPSFRWLPWSRRWGRAVRPLLRVASPALEWSVPPGRRAKWRHLYQAGGNPLETYRALRGLFMPEELSGLVGPRLREPDIERTARETLLALEEDLLPPSQALTASASAACLETRLYLASQLLRDIDAMSMAHSLEVRVPLVDHELLGTVWPALGSHPHLVSHKKLLHETLAKPLPPGVVNRPKQGFLLPFQEWMAGDLQDMVLSGMHRLEAQGWLARRAAELVWAQWRDGAVHWSRPWALGILGTFLGDLA